MKYCTTLLLAVLVSVTTSGTVALGQDWPQWRGPNRDGDAAFRVPTVWPDMLTEQWSVAVGLGYATPLLSANRVYQFVRQGDEEVMMALDADTGDFIWRTTYPAPFTMNPSTSDHGPGPKSTPALADARLFTLGISGIVTAFEADTGTVLWQKPAQPVEPLYHTAMSPVVENGIVIVHVGGHDAGALTAFDVATGEVRWRWEGDGPAYGSPIVIDAEDTRQVVTFTQNNLVGVAVTTGELLWRRPFTTPFDSTAQTPIWHENMLLQSGPENGVTGFRVVREGGAWTTEDIWHTGEVAMQFSTGVVVDGVLFGLSHLNRGQYFALDLNTGNVLWSSASRQAESAAIVRSGNTIFSLEDDAELVVIRHSLTGFEPLGRYDVAPSAMWTHPTLSGNRLYIKDETTLTLWTVD